MIGPIKPGIGPLNPGIGPDPKLIEGLAAPEFQKVEREKSILSSLTEEKNEYQEFAGILGKLSSATDSIKYKDKFAVMSVDSSHPELLEGVAHGFPEAGSFEIEVGSLSKRDRHLDIGFPDRNKTTVGFGYMGISVGDAIQNSVKIPPGSTLNDVKDIINSKEIGVSAMVVNTGMENEPFRLLVSSNKLGESARVNIDTDTTFLEMDNIARGSDLKAKFEGVDIKGDGNKLNELLPGVNLLAKQASPGTKIKIDIKEDIEATFEGVHSFVEAYNGLAAYSSKLANPDTGAQVSSASKSEVRSAMRQIRSKIHQPQNGSYSTLAAVGITTNPKSGELVIDDKKLKESMTKDFAGVANLFVVNENGSGVAGTMAEVIKNLQDPVNGVLKTRLSGLDTKIRSQNHSIEVSQQRAEDRKAALTNQMNKANQRVAQISGQQQFLNQRLETSAAN